MSNIKKTIIVNPELFKFTSGSQTRKNKDKQTKPLPVVSPNHLKTKLLNRIKQHKNNEVNELKQKNTELQNDKYTDEFYDAIGYLSDLSKKHKTQTHVQNKTLKSYHDPNTNHSSPYVQLDLPLELQEPIVQNSNTFMQPMHLNYKVDSLVPHGCLRGGQKPTYRTWQKTQKHYPPINVQVEPSLLQQQQTQAVSREERLSIIKKKLQNLETKQTPKQNQTISIQTDPVSEEPVSLSFSPEPSLPTPSLSVIKESPLPAAQTVEPDNSNKNVLAKGKKYIKTTVRRKYTLGKSNMYRKVGVLVKDKNTRKNVLNAHKELKRTPISEIKNYLRSHGIMKVGSTAPNDVLRKTYECSRLAGEINNTNKDVLLHNFMQESEF